MTTQALIRAYWFTNSIQNNQGTVVVLIDADTGECVEFVAII